MRLRLALRQLLLILGILALPFQIGFALIVPPNVEVDALQVWLQVERVRSSLPLYRPMPEHGPDRWYPEDNSPYPPVLAAAISLLHITSWDQFRHFWYISLLLALWAYAGVLARLHDGVFGWRGFAVANGALLLVPGSWIMFAQGNVDPLLWLLFSAALLYPRFRGAGLALCTAIKPYAVWPLVFALARDRRRVVGSLVLAFVAAFAVCAMAMGAGGFARAAADWFRYVLPAASQGTFHWTNISLTFLPVRVARWLGWGYAGGPLDAGVRLVMAVTSIVGPLATGIAMRRARPDLQYGAVMVAALLFSPLCWAAYLPIALAPLAVWRQDVKITHDRARHLEASVAIGLNRTE